MTKILTDKQADAVYEAIIIMRMVGGRFQGVLEAENQVIHVKDNGSIRVSLIQYPTEPFEKEEYYSDKDAFFDAYLCSK